MTIRTRLKLNTWVSLGTTVQAMAMTVETRDPYTAGHQRCVADLARAIAPPLPYRLALGIEAELAEIIEKKAFI